MSDFDFSKPFQESQKVEEIKQKAAKVKAKKSETSNKPTKSSWLLVLVLMISLAAIGSFSLVEMKSLQGKVSKLENTTGQVSGVTTKAKTTITGTSFTIVTEGEIPEGYQMNYSTTDFTYLNQDNRQGSVNTYIATISKEAKEYNTGIEVKSSEYDNAWDSKRFAEEVGKKLGSDYIQDSNDITIQKGVKLSKFENSDNNLVYYTAVTEQNYYVIKVYNQTLQNSDLIEYSRYTSSFIQNLYLN